MKISYCIFKITIKKMKKKIISFLASVACVAESFLAIWPSQYMFLINGSHGFRLDGLEHFESLHDTVKLLT